MFVIILRYLVDISIIDQHRPAHLKFLDEYYEKGCFIASGPQNPRYGGVIIAKASNRDELEAILAQDPYKQNKCAEYQITSFAPNKFAKGAENLFTNMLSGL